MRGMHTRPGRSTRARRAMAVASAGLMAVAAFVVGPRLVLADTETLTLEASPPSGTVGADIPNLGATATLTGADSPSNAVSFTLHSDSNCQSAATPTASGSGTLSANGDGSYSASYSQDWTPTAVGTYYWQATYIDPIYGAVVSNCGDLGSQVDIAQAMPTIATQANPMVATVGAQISVGDTATFSNTTSVAPTGSVTFMLYSDPACQTAVQNVSGTGQINTSGGVSTATYNTNWTPTAPGTYSWIASYPGDTNNQSFTTQCTDANEQLTVGTAAPGITTQASPTIATVGVQISVGDTATFSNTTSVAPTGSVTFTLYSDFKLRDGGAGGERNRANQHFGGRLNCDIQHQLDAADNGDILVDCELPR